MEDLKEHLSSIVVVGLLLLSLIYDGLLLRLLLRFLVADRILLLLIYHAVIYRVGGAKTRSGMRSEIDHFVDFRRNLKVGTYDFGP